MPPPPPPPPMPSNPVTMEGNGPSRPPKTTTTGVIIAMNVINTVTQIILGGVVFSAFLFTNAFNGSKSLTQHVYLCVLGYVILMSQAILTFNPHTGWANALKYPNKRMIHWMMQVVGSVLAITGSIIRISNLGENAQTAHGILGIIAMMLTVVSLIGGAANLAFPKQLSSLVFRIIHICVGILTISIAFICLCFGFDGVYRGVMGDSNADLSISLTIIALIGVLFGTCMNLTKKIRCC